MSTRTSKKLIAAGFETPPSAQSGAVWGDSIENVSKMGNVKGHFSPLSDMSSTCQVIGKTGGHGTSRIAVHGHGGGTGFGDISFSSAPNAPSNTANGWLDIEPGGYALHLDRFMQHEQWPPEEAADRPWSDILETARISIG